MTRETVGLFEAPDTIAQLLLQCASQPPALRIAIDRVRQGRFVSVMRPNAFGARGGMSQMIDGPRAYQTPALQFHLARPADVASRAVAVHRLVIPSRVPPGRR